jgi:hypothetical protein
MEENSGLKKKKMQESEFAHVSGDESARVVVTTRTIKHFLPTSKAIPFDFRYSDGEIKSPTQQPDQSWANSQCRPTFRYIVHSSIPIADILHRLGLGELEYNKMP